MNGTEIQEEEVAALTQWMRERVEAPGMTAPFTFFDFTTAMAILYFSQKRVDLAILEVGLGGRLDSTNVIDPLLSIITNVTKDHEEILGRSLLKIAREKAGIIKKGRPLITAATQPRILHLFAELCREKDAPFYRVGRDFRYEPVGERNFHYEGLHRKLWSVGLNLSGPHQFINATTALGAMEVLEDLGYPVSTEAMTEGLRDVRWPGRLRRCLHVSKGCPRWRSQPGRSPGSQKISGRRISIQPAHPPDGDHEGQRPQIDSSNLSPSGMAYHSLQTPYGAGFFSIPASRGLGDEWEKGRNHRGSSPGHRKGALSDPKRRPLLYYGIPLYRGRGEGLSSFQGETMKAFRISPHFLLHSSHRSHRGRPGKVVTDSEGACG